MSKPQAGVDGFPADLHPATARLVRDFAQALAAKLMKAQTKYGYSNGWLTEDWEKECRLHLLDHLSKGDPLDVAAYCAFMWRRGWPTIEQIGTRKRRVTGQLRRKR